MKKKIRAWKTYAGIHLEYYYIQPTGAPTLADLGFTIVTPFYNEYDRFQGQIKNYNSQLPALKEEFKVIFVDDGSDPPLSTWKGMDSIGFNLSVYRISDDVRGNTAGAFNLGVSQAVTNWILTSESDFLLTPEVLNQIAQIEPKEMSVYRFHRARRKHRMIGAMMLFQQSTFREVGGFDEDFVTEWGDCYGCFDQDFNNKCRECGYQMRCPKGVMIPDMRENQFRHTVSKEQIRRARSMQKEKWEERVAMGHMADTEKLRFKWQKVR